MKAALKEESSRTPQAAYLSRQRLIAQSTMRDRRAASTSTLVGDLEDLESLVANATGALLRVPRSRVRLRHLQYSIGTSATR